MAAPAGLPVVLVLAAGRGERFIASGGTGSKLQAQLAGRPVIEHTMDAVRASGLPWHVETGPHAGMGDSIAAAVRATPHADGWLVLPADLPLVRPGTLRAVADALSRAPVVLPVHAGQPGHPVGFARACGPALAALSGPLGAAAVVRSHAACRVQVDDEGAIIDVDTVAALAHAQAVFSRRNARS
jgi:molybdenum cofactor cytidylyltransferase